MGIFQEFHSILEITLVFKYVGTNGWVWVKDPTFDSFKLQQYSTKKKSAKNSCRSQRVCGEYDGRIFQYFLEVRYSTHALIDTICAEKKRIN